MKEKARITKIEGNKVFLSTVPHSECAGCRSCSASKKGRMVLMEEHPERYVEGEEVLVFMEPEAMMKLYLILYGLPLLVFLAGTVGIYTLLENPALAFGGAVALTAGGYCLAACYLKKAEGLYPNMRKL